MDENGQILLSICLPTYNRAELIKKQLSFIMEEALPFVGSKIEILVSNNASPDDTGQVITDISAKIGKDLFRYFNQTHNIGAVQNVHFLVGKASGKYVWVVGDDDILRPGTVGRVIGLLERYGKDELGAVFLGIVDDYKREHLREGEILWDELKIAGQRFGLLRYDRENAGDYEFRGPYGDLLFITRSIVLREAWLRVSAEPAYKNLDTAPFAAHLLAIRNRAFYVDEQVSVYMSVARATWSHKAAELSSIENMLCFLSLHRVGIPEAEAGQIINSFLLSTSNWVHAFHPKLSFNPGVIARFVWLVTKEGYLLSFLVGLTRGFARYLHNRLRLLWEKNREEAVRE